MRRIFVVMPNLPATVVESAIGYTRGPMILLLSNRAFSCVVHSEWLRTLRSSMSGASQAELELVARIAQ